MMNLTITKTESGYFMLIKWDSGNEYEYQWTDSVQKEAELDPEKGTWYTQMVSYLQEDAEHWEGRNQIINVDQNDNFTRFEARNGLSVKVQKLPKKLLNLFNNKTND